MPEPMPLPLPPGLLCEGPHWNARENRLLWVDIQGQLIHSADADGGRPAARRVTEPVTFAIPSADRSLFLGVDGKLCRMRENDAGYQVVSAPALPSGCRFNDAKCDARGRLWAGTMNSARPADADGALYCFEDGILKKKESGFAVSNGLGWNPEGTLLYQTETEKQTIWCYDFDQDTGALSGKRAFARVSGPGKPDGLCVDSEGRILSAQWDGGGIQVYSRDGNPERLISLPCPQVTSCCLGGAEMKTLFITTARAGMSEADLRHAPLSGRIFTMEWDVPGLAAIPVARN